MAADLMLIMLDDASGDLRVHPRVAGYALAGALLVELWWQGRLTVGDRQIAVVADQLLPGDALLRRTLGCLLAAPDQVGVTSWIDAIATTALDRVGDQLERAEFIRRVARRRGSVRFEAVDRQRVFWRPSRLLLMLGRQPTWPDIFLFALVDAAGLAEGLLAQAAYPPPPERIRTLSAGLAQSYPGTVELVAVVRRLADRIAVAPR